MNISSENTSAETDINDAEQVAQNSLASADEVPSDGHDVRTDQTAILTDARPEENLQSEQATQEQIYTDRTSTGSGSLPVSQTAHGPSRIARHDSIAINRSLHDIAAGKITLS